MKSNLTRQVTLRVSDSVYTAIALQARMQNIAVNTRINNILRNALADPYACPSENSNAAS